MIQSCHSPVWAILFPFIFSACQAPTQNPLHEPSSFAAQTAPQAPSSPQTHPDDWTFIEASIPNVRLEIQDENVTALPVWIHKSAWDKYTKSAISTLITAVNTTNPVERDVKLITSNQRRPRHIIFDKFNKNPREIEAYPITLPGIIGPVSP